MRRPGEAHEALKELLPWYVNGGLDAAEHAQVEAHVADCRQCQADVAFQRRLGSEVARLPLDVERGWSRMQRRIDDEALGPWRRTLRSLAVRSPWLGAGAVTAMALTMAILVLPRTEKVEYRTLSSPAPARPAGEVVVVFRPDATERQVREALKAQGVGIVGGPTAADAYILSAPPGRRDAVVKGLRDSGIVVMAEPLAAEVGP